MEEYKLGDWSSGRKQKAEITLNVRQQTPTEYPIMMRRSRLPSHYVNHQMTTVEDDTETDVTVNVAEAEAALDVTTIKPANETITRAVTAGVTKKVNKSKVLFYNKISCSLRSRTSLLASVSVWEH